MPSYRRRPGALAPLLLASTLLGACASVDPGPTYRDVGTLLAERQTPPPEWVAGSNPLNLDEATLLGRDDVVRLVVQHSPSLQAKLEEVGIAVADLAQATRLSNPGLSASARSASGESGTNVELGIAQNLLQLLTLSARKRLARSELEETKLHVAKHVLATARDAETAYLELVAAQQRVDLREVIHEAASASYDLAQRFFDAGNINELQLRREQALFEETRVAMLESQKERTRARRALRDLLGTWGETERLWQVGSRLPDLPAETLDVAELEVQAVEERLDLQAGVQEVRTLELALGITRRWRLLGGLEIEASAERELDGVWVIGPGIDLQLPIFDQGQPRLARAQAALRQAERQLEAQIAMARSEVNQLHEQLDLERELAGRYLHHVIPMNQRTVRLAQEQYNYMLIGIFEVLEAKNDEYDAYAHYIDTVRDYWQTRAQLRFAVGGRLPDVPFEVTGDPPAAKAPEEEHDHQGHNDTNHDDTSHDPMNHDEGDLR